MNRFYYITTALMISGLFLFGCQQKNTPITKEFSGKKIADPIIYEVLVNNPNPEDEWKEECLANTDTKELVKDILNAVQRGDLNAFDYYDNHQLSKEEIEKIILESNFHEKIGNIQFEEEWYWNKKQLRLQKRVRKLMFGYEVYDANGKIRGYKASFVVELDTDDRE